MPIRPSTERWDFGAEALVADQFAQISPNNGTFFLSTMEDLVTLSGSTTLSTIQIPTNSLVFSCSAYVKTAITTTGSPTGWSWGYSGSPTLFGTGMGFTAGTTAAGVITPTGFYSNTKVQFTPVAGTSPTFSGGLVRIVVTYMTFTPPTS
jgi:hypothetical protein